MSERQGAWLRVLVPLVLVVLLALAWKLTPLGDRAAELARWVGALEGSALAPLVVVAVFVTGGLLAMPLTVLVVATILTFGGLAGAAYAMLGSLASAAAMFGVGRLVGRQSVERLLGERTRRAANALSERGVLTMAIVRNLPVAPYSVVNLVAGATSMRLLDYLLGTFLGLLPGILALTVFGESLARFVRAPDLRGGVILVVVVVGVSLLSFLLGRRLMPGGKRNGD